MPPDTAETRVSASPRLSLATLPNYALVESRRLRCAPPRPGAAPGSALEGRPAHAGQHPERTQIKAAHTSCRPGAMPAVFLAHKCPARSHRVNGGPHAVARNRLRRPLTRPPLPPVFSQVKTENLAAG